MGKDSLKLPQTLGNASDFASLLSSETLSLPFTQKLAFLTLKKTQNKADKATIKVSVTFPPANGKPVLSILATGIYTAIFALHTKTLP